jgi:hypothetical protein
MAGYPPDQPMRFEFVGNGGNCVGCEWVSAMGVITSDTPEVFARFLANQSGFVPTVTFHSEGGDIRAALMLGMMIRERGISTSVGETFENGQWHNVRPGTCLSACAYALLGGKHRFVGKYDQIGVHQWYNQQAILTPDRATLSAVDAMRDQALLGKVLAYLRRMGIDPRLLTLASETPPTDMTILSEDMLTEFGIDNMVFRNSGWSIRPDGAGIVANIETQYGVEAPKHLRFYCASDGSHIFFSRSLDGVEPESFINAMGQTQLYLDDNLMKTWNIHTEGLVSHWNGHLRLKLPLSDDEWRRIRRSEGRLLLFIDLPGVYGFQDGASVSLHGAGPFLDAARRNCL